MPQEISPEQTPRARAYELWMHAPNPMVSFFKTLDVTNLLRASRRKGLKFNMLLTYCIGKAAAGMREFYLLPVGDKLLQYERLAVNTIVRNRDKEVSSCDVEFTEDLTEYNRRYLTRTEAVALLPADFVSVSPHADGRGPRRPLSEPTPARSQHAAGLRFSRRAEGRRT